VIDSPLVQWTVRTTSSPEEGGFGE